MIQYKKLYITDIINLQKIHVEKKKYRIKLFLFLATKFFIWSNRLKDKADILILSGGDQKQFKEKMASHLKPGRWSSKDNTPYRKPSIEEAVATLKEHVVTHGTEMKGKTYAESKKQGGGGLVPAKPGFFKPTDDVINDKKIQIENEQKVTQPVTVKITKPTDNNSKSSQSRKFYYKRKRQKFNKNINKGNKQN